MSHSAKNPTQQRPGQSTALTAAEQHQEGPVARAIEDQTAKVPSDVFLWTAGAAAATSLVLDLLGMKDKSRFIGQWVPSILICGVYNKIVKVHGSDQLDRPRERPAAGGPWGDRSSDRTHQIGQGTTTQSRLQSGPPSATYDRGMSGDRGQERSQDRSQEEATASQSSTHRTEPEQASTGRSGSQRPSQDR